VINDEMKLEFERAFVHKFGFGAMSAASNADAAAMFGAAAWAWQASRAAVEVELPTVADYFDQSVYPRTCELLGIAMRSSIEAAGLKVKP